MKKIFRFISSMKFALLMLLLLGAACVAGSVQSSYDVYHTWWFYILAAGLALSLIFCNISRVGSIAKRSYSSAGMDAAEPDAVIEANPEGLFYELGFRTVEHDGDRLYSVKNRIGAWGPWLTHVGILIIIIGFTLGQIATVKYTVYGVPGQTKPVGDTGYELTIDSFETKLRDDETVEQYVSNVTMTNTATGASKSAEISVNHPASLFGMKLYQNSTGWATRVLVYKNDELIQNEVLCGGETISVKDKEKLQLTPVSFYPDYVRSADGTPSTAGPLMNNPAWLYMLTFDGEVLGMNVLEGGEKITVDDYSFILTDTQQYSLVQLKDDPYTWLALIGGIVLLAALFISFYVRTAELLAAPEGDKWNIYGRSKRGGLLFKDMIKLKAEEFGGH